MVPVMIEENEFVISFDISTGNIKLRNPHGKGNDGNYALLKTLIDGLVKNTNQTVELTEEKINAIYADYCRDNPEEKVIIKHFIAALMIGVKLNIENPKVTPEPAAVKLVKEGDGPMNRSELEEYHRMNLKNMVVRDAPFYKKILEVKENSERLHAIGGEDPNSSGYYRAIAWVLKTIDEDTPKPYPEA